MKNKLHIFTVSLLSVLIILSAAIAFGPENKQNDTINDILNKSEIENSLKENYQHIAQNNANIAKAVGTMFDNDITRLFDSLAIDFDKYQIGYFHYNHGLLEHWSTNDIPMPTKFSRSLSDRCIILGNGYYLANMQITESHAVVSVFQIKKTYSYQNDLLTEKFNKGLKIPDNIAVSTDFVENALNIRLPLSDKDIFLSNPNETVVSNYISPRQLVQIGFLLLIITIIIYSSELLVKKFKNKASIIAIGFIVNLFALRFILLITNFFHSFTNLYFFSPQLLSTSFMQTSFADLLLNVTLFVIGAIFFCRHFNYTAEQKSKSTLVTLATSLLFAVVSYGIVKFCSEIVLNSSVAYNFVNFTDFDIYGLLATLIMTEVLFACIFVLRKIYRLLVHRINARIFIISLLVMLGICASISLLNGENIILTYLIIWLIWYFVVYAVIKQKHSFAYRTALMIFGALLVTYIIAQKVETKDNEAFKVLAYNMSAERDFDLEYNLIQLDNEIRSNKPLVDSIKNKNYTFAQKAVFDLISTKKYLNSYDIQLVICHNNDSLFFDETSCNCFDYFKQEVIDYGVIIPNTNFYFLDNNNGRKSYLGVFSQMIEPQVFVKMYLELDSKIFSEGLGYPDLLLDKKLAMHRSDRKFDFARYSKKVLVASRGSYKYLFSLDYQDESEEYSISRRNGYVHYKYSPDSENTIILSKHDTTFSNGFIIFFFVLICIFIVYTINLLIQRILHKQDNINNSLARRIRTTFILVLVTSLMLTMTASVFFIIDSYGKRQKEAVHDKVHSVAIELSHSIDLNNFRYQDFEMVNDYLAYLSGILCVDINIYNLRGVLAATSRQEFFDKGLKGRFMSPTAYKHLAIYNEELFTHDEVIDKADYLSVYLPLKNANNKVVAYLNLPYFAAEADIQEEMSNYVAVFASIFLLLILVVIVVGFFISRQVTIPLSILQTKISNIDLNAARKIEYARKDEIGLLIDEYNRKVDELLVAAQKLAASERESAWREMARQIAHEIRNPLTPMKLRIQYMEKAFKEKTPGWEKQLEQLPQMLIEQIDVLDATASQFSNFAKMQAPQKVNLNLSELLSNLVKLHSQTDNVEVVLVENVRQEPIIFADRDQILRAFTNLIKNSIQAIPSDRKGFVTISISDENDKIKVTVADNGCGIPAEIRAKIFQPNFTTKTSGMGLGLSMVKNIIFANEAEIDFETEEGKYTKFYVYFGAVSIDI